MVTALRTPDDRFVNLEGFPYDPIYIEILKGFEGLRMDYIDEGPRDVDQIFLYCAEIQSL